MRGASVSAVFFRRGLMILFLAAFLSGCRVSTRPTAVGSVEPETPTPEVFSGKVVIYIQDDGFRPKEINVKAGTTVSWINRDPEYHCVISDTHLFRSNLLALGQMFSYTFNEPGTYAYYSDDQGGPGGVGMSGVIVVVA
jgi:plastocyanin